MSELRSLLDEWKSVDSGALSLSELNEDIVELCRGIDQMKVLIADRLAEIDSRGLERLGHPSITSYLTHVGRMSAGSARRYAGRVKAKKTAPHAYKTWADGRITADQAGHLFRMAESVPDEFSDAEERLVEIVEPLSVRSSARALEYWRQAVDGPGELDLEVQLTRRGLYLSRTTGGMRRIDGWLTQLAGEALEAVLADHMPAPSEDDTRTARQRRHDALEEMANAYLARDSRGEVGGERPHIQLLVDLNALRGVGGGAHETADRGDVVDVETIRLVSCDSSISRIVVGPQSEVIDVGRKTRVWSAAQRRAIVARDRHCTWHGCDRPAKWADIHHIVHWADGGETSLVNGRLLCRFHHTLTHAEDRMRRRRRSG